MCDEIPAHARPNVTVDQIAIEPPSAQRETDFLNSEICLRRSARSVTSHQWLAAAARWYHLAVAWFVHRSDRHSDHLLPHGRRRLGRGCTAVILYAATAEAEAAAAAARHYEPFSIIPFSLCDTSTASDMILQGDSFLLLNAGYYCMLFECEEMNPRLTD